MFGHPPLWAAHEVLAVGPQVYLFYHIAKAYSEGSSGSRRAIEESMGLAVGLLVLSVVLLLVYHRRGKNNHSLLAHEISQAVSLVFLMQASDSLPISDDHKRLLLYSIVASYSLLAIHLFQLGALGAPGGFALGGGSFIY